MKCNPNSATANLLRNRLKVVLKDEKIDTAISELIGTSIDDCRGYIEDRFEDGMSWLNHGEWHIDHRRPCASFDLSNEVELKMCFHYTNLQPLWATDNLSKRASFDEDSFEWEWDDSKWVEKD